MSETEKVKCLIIGSGPAGYTAAIYAARANLHPVLYTGMEMGGQLTTTTEIENFPGYPEGISGTAMMEDLKNQAEKFGTDVRFGVASSVDFSSRPHKVVFDESHTIEAESVIIATGATARYLGLPSEEKFKGSGVSGCATCDGFFYKGQTVAVVGGGDTAAEEATYLAGLAKQVYLIIRKDHMRASQVMQERVINTPNIKVLFNNETLEILGDQTVNGVRVFNNKTNEEKILPIDGFFLAIGHTPNTEIFKPYLKMNDTGYLYVEGTSTHTNVPGVFAAGDVADSVYRQAVTAAGMGCKAAKDAERYMGESELLIN